MADFRHWFGPGHADGFSREVAQASVSVAAAKDALYEALQRGYPEGAEVYVVHHRGCFHGTVDGWDTHGCRVIVKNTVTGKTSKWWAAHVELVNVSPGVVASDPVRCKDCDVPNGCPEYCWCDAAGAGKAEYASWFPIRPHGVSEARHQVVCAKDADGGTA